MGLWAVVPVKERVAAKERLAPILRPEARQALALAMLEDVLAAVTAAPGIAGLLVVTVDAEAGELAARYGARVTELGAPGHTGRDRRGAGSTPAGALLYDRPVA